MPGTASAAPEDPAEGLARVIASDLLTADLADAVSASSGSQTDQGPNAAAIDAEVLNSLIGVQLPTIGLPLIASGGNPGLLDLGDAAAAGALNAASASPADDSSVAAAGAVGDNGAIDLGTVGDPTTIGDARLDLTALLGQLGVDDITDTVVDQLSVELGALASRAAQTGAEAERTYGLAGA
ncbi:hypothetical protein EHW97_04085 [Aeromicrobium camelliae]|uniref:Uncharacterized protein n=1 Tax=Aeromicrobium camelliae TaxID=1538144 RepID=A0A3N6YHZ5_9ACTN|nr:hypothetical protein EHW97_04085 [Aeromicrobium camelliae]